MPGAGVREVDYEFGAVLRPTDYRDRDRRLVYLAPLDSYRFYGFILVTGDNPIWRRCGVGYLATQRLRGWEPDPKWP